MIRRADDLERAAYLANDQTALALLHAHEDEGGGYSEDEMNAVADMRYLAEDRIEALEKAFGALLVHSEFFTRDCPHLAKAHATATRTLDTKD